MATYNGAAYLQEQLESIINQTYTDWELWVRDDLSTDNTPELLAAYAAKDARIKVLDLPGKHGSAAINFSVLFNYTAQHTNGYIMFSDQDDIWLKDKVEKSLNYIKTLESHVRSDMPVLVYANFQFVAADGAIIDKDIPIPASLALKGMMTENHAYGCTMILNPALVKAVEHIPYSVENHDYWVALVAATFGTAIFNPEKLLHYRQHGNNVSGTVARSTANARLARYFKNTRLLLPELQIRYKMLSMFYTTYKDKFNTTERRLLKSYLDAFQKSSLRLLRVMLTNGIGKLGILQTLAHYYTLCRLRADILSDKPMGKKTFDLRNEN